VGRRFVLWMPSDVALREATGTYAHFRSRRNPSAITPSKDARVSRRIFTLILTKEMFKFELIDYYINLKFVHEFFFFSVYC
jgi:hypothetical protein